MRKLVAYEPPKWAEFLHGAPPKRFMLINAPTPVQNWSFDYEGETYNLLIKRDDLTEGIGGGNKARKLEFLLAAAKEAEADTVVTIGGTNSNHCRATAAFCGMLGMECHLVLRKDLYYERSEGLVQGNMLLDNWYGAHSHLVERERYQKDGSAALLEGQVRRLAAAGKKPYAIPVGGSNEVGVWGYLQAVEELACQLPSDVLIDVVAFASGSGGTAAGLAIGMNLHPRFEHTSCVGYMVCDNAEYFYKQVQQECDRLHLERDAHKLLQFRDARGLGYSVATREEVAFQRQVAQSSGIMLDSCYSGKAAYALAQDMKKGDFSGKRVLFIHTGGVFGLFALPRELAVDQTLIHHYE